MTDDMMTRIESAAAALIEAGAQQVYLFGSWARGTAKDESDVDLAVSGLPPEIFFEAMGKARRALRHSLDLVDLDDDTPFTNYLPTSGEMKRVA